MSQNHKPTPITNGHELPSAFLPAKREEPVSNEEEKSECFSQCLLQWPVRVGSRYGASSERLAIFQKAMKDIKKVLFPRWSSKMSVLSGPAFQQYYNVFCFLKLQVFQEKQAVLRRGISLLRSRKTLAKQVADGSQSSWRNIRQMMTDEVSWVQYQRIALGKQGQHQKVACMLND